MKKSFKDLARQVNALQEPNQGQLKGGFASFGKLAQASLSRRDVNVNVNVYDGASCACACAKDKVA